MGFEDISERAESVRFQNDVDAMNDDGAKIGEGANNPTFYSSRGYVVKPVMYDWQSKDPFEQAETVNKIARFPWVEVEELVSDDPFDRAMVRMQAADMMHEKAEDTFRTSEVVRADIDMFTELREQDITYKDFKPDNLGYFWEDNGVLQPKPIDIFDVYAWEQQGNLAPRKFADIIDTYLQGTPDEKGLTDMYSINAVEAEKEIMNHLGLDEKHLTGDPYDDIQEAIETSEQEYSFL